MSGTQLYDTIGATYTVTRRTDPRIAAAIWTALGDARTVLNVGAGTGSYEPPDRDVTAVEPSTVMIEQRAPDAAPVVQATAESLPFEDDSFDAAMAVLSEHHWSDRAAGLRELARVARDRVVIFSADPAEFERFWLTRDYLQNVLELSPPRYRVPGAWAREYAELLGGELTVGVVPTPHDCVDSFYGSYWKRPHAYLDPAVRAATSVFSRVSGDVEAQLRADL